MLFTKNITYFTSQMPTSGRFGFSMMFSQNPRH